MVQAADPGSDAARARVARACAEWRLPGGGARRSVAPWPRQARQPPARPAAADLERLDYAEHARRRTRAAAGDQSAADAERRQRGHDQLRPRAQAAVLLGHRRPQPTVDELG